MPSIDEADVLRKFDSLVAQGEIQWVHSEPVNRTISDFEFEYRVCSALASKPQISNSSGESSSEDEEEDEKPRVKSDIQNESPLFNLTQVGPYHDLILNRFCVYRPQYILLTKDPVHNQHEPLDRRDIAASLLLLHASPSPIFVIYNCGEKAGCSRSHRHMQAFPSPGSKANTALALFPDRVPKIPEKSIPFKYFLHHFPESWVGEDGPTEARAGDVMRMYLELLEKTRRVLGIKDPEEHVPHNVVLVKEWLMVIPRRGGQVGGSAVNAAAMLGMVWVKTDEELEEWTKMSIDESLAMFGVPADAPES